MNFPVLVQASRPKTLIASFFPTLAGILLAWNFGFLKLLVALATLACAILLQVLTNYANDYFDFKKGADTEERLGPKRVTQAGLLSTSDMKQAILIIVFLCLLLGVYLVLEGGFLILLTGVISVLFAMGYTAGPFPLAYYGLGEVFSFVFFGVVATCGSFYLQTGFLNLEAICVGTLFGFLSTALIVTNNLRDVDQDAQANKKTIVVRFGENFGRFIFSISIYGTVLALLVFILLKLVPWTCLGAMVVLPLAHKMSQYVWANSRKDVIPLFPMIAKYFLIYGCLFNLGLILYRFI